MPSTDASPANVSVHLPEMARRQPDAPAVILQKGMDRYRTLSFSELNKESDLLAAGLEGMGIKRGTRTVLMVTPGPEFFALTFALLKAGIVPVMVDPGMGTKNLGECLKEAEPEAFIGITKAHVARILFGWARQTLKKLVTVGPRLFWGGASLKAVRADGASAQPYKMPEVEAEETAAILFTSGSTGVPKGAIYSHGIFSAQVDSLRAVYGIQPGEMDLATFPLFALFGPALGMTAIIPDMDATRPGSADPARLVAAAQKWQATNMFGSPAVVDNMGRYGVARSVQLPSLKRVISAGAPARTEALERFQKMLAPGVEIHTPYGATESLPVSSIGSAEILGETCKKTAAGRGVCVGLPAPGMEVKVIRITDEPIETWSDELLVPDEEIGEIVVKGPVVTKAYYNRDSSTRLAKIQDPTNGGFWHRMGDVGYLDGTRRLWMCGRKSHRIETSEGTLFTVPCEGVFNAHAQVFRTALVGVGDPGEQTPVLCVELEKNASSSEDDIKRELLELGSAHAHTKGISRLLLHPSFPVDIRHNAKIFREKLRPWAAAQL